MFIKSDMMEPQIEKKYTLAPGTKVREENFGLLFYTMAGPRLYFLYSGQELGPSFFNGNHTLAQWIRLWKEKVFISEKQIRALESSLHCLKEKGVILEC